MKSYKSLKKKKDTKTQILQEGAPELGSQLI